MLLFLCLRSQPELIPFSKTPIRIPQLKLLLLDFPHSEIAGAIVFLLALFRLAEYPSDRQDESEETNFPALAPL